MSELREFKCDGCGRDLTYTSMETAYRLNLTAEPMAHNSGAVFSMRVEPDIKAPAHFCGWGCLRDWVNRPTKRDQASADSLPLRF